MSFYVFYPPANAVVIPPGAATAANQVLEIAQLTGIHSDTTSINGKVSTAANQASQLAQETAIAASVASIDTKFTNPLPVSVASVPLPAGAATEATLLAFSNKTAGALVSEDFDYQTITYIGATTDIDTVVYKTGGAGGTTVATLTMGYDGSNRLSTVTKT